MASTYLYRATDATANSGYSTTWTWSGWVKRSRLGSPEQGIFMNKKDSDNTASRFRMSFGSSDKLLWECKDSTNSDDNSFQTNMLFRDVNAWYHIVFSFDSSQSTEADRLKLWVNGVDIRNNGGGFSSIDEASNGFGTLWSSASKHYVGLTSNNSGTSHYFDGIMSHVHLTYGTTYPASTFGSTDATTGQWKINTSPSVTYGSQGYFILKDGNSVTDQSGQSNNFTTSGTLTKTEDCPSNVFATWNPLARSTAYSGQNSPTNGNTTFVSGETGTNYPTYTSTLGVSSGKYYFECKMGSSGGAGAMIGISDSKQLSSFFGSGTYDYGYFGYDGKLYNGSSSSYGSTYGNNDIIGCAVDLDNNKLYFHKNGTYQNSGDPTSGSTGTGAISIADPSTTTTGFYFFTAGDAGDGDAPTINANFGNGTFGTASISSEGTNASGIGKFEYDCPNGYTGLSTKGLNE